MYKNIERCGIADNIFSFPRHQVIFNNSLREEDQGALLVRLPIDQVFFKGWNGNIEDLQTLS